MLIFHLAICILIGSISTTYIEKDTATVPTIYDPNREIEFEISELEYSYQLDLSIVYRLKKEYLHIANLCHTSKYKQPLYQIIFGINSIWNNKTDKRQKTENIVNIEPFAIQALKSDYFYFKQQNDSNTKCNTLKSFLNQLMTLDIELKKIGDSTYTSISSIIPVEKLLKDAHNFTSKTKLVSPLDFTHWFSVNFFKYSKIYLSFTTSYAFVTIKIPLFSHTILFRIFPKPILYNNVPYIFNSQTEYVIKDQIGTNYFSNLNENCFYANNNTFCKKPKYQNNCDSQYLTHSTRKFDRDCFIRLPLRNTVTQIKNSIYFLIFEPMLVNISCNGSLQSIRMYQSSQILNNDCHINSTFFTYDPNSIREYGIFFSNNTQDSNEYGIYQNSELKSLINFYCFISFSLLYTVTLGILIFFHYKLKTRNSEILDTPV